MGKTSKLVLLFCVCMGLLHCAERCAPPTDCGLTGNPPGDSVQVRARRFGDASILTNRQVAQTGNAFGLELFRELVKAQPDSNIIVSPLSVSMALGMTLNGAAGATLEAMQSTLGFSGSTMGAVNRGYKHLIDLLEWLDPQVQFEIANSVWCQEGIAFKGPFLEACQVYFDAEIRDVDFLGDPDAPDSINAWVNEKTYGKIPSIVPKPLSGQTVMMLVDAIYFLGTWQYEFDPAYTYDEWFALRAGTATLCRMMKRPGPEPEDPSNENLCDYVYYSDDTVQIVDLAYGDSVFSMTVLLPRRRVHVDSLIGWMNATTWDTWITNLQDCRGQVLMPRFEIEYRHDLKQVLTAMGMGIAFTPGEADFSGIADMVLWIERVLHGTYIRVDESGTEAGAVTLVEECQGITPDCYGFYMKVNRPFVFAIRENQANTILFIGKVADPGYY